MLDTLHHTLQSAWNHLWFDWRCRFPWSKGAYTEPSEDKSHLFEPASEQALLAKRLFEGYHLHRLYQSGTCQRYLETLTYLTHLEGLFTSLPSNLPTGPANWLDVGCKNWSYVEALYQFGQQQIGTPLQLTGIELDAYRRYTDWYRRIDYAHAFIQPLPHTTYQAGDVMNHQGQYDIVSCFLPFVLIEPCLAWGLPKRYFQPQAFLAHLFSLVKPQGLLLLVNQGDVEQAAMAQLLSRYAAQFPQIHIQYQGILPNSFGYHQHSRHGWVCQKQALPISTQKQTLEDSCI